MNAVVIGTGVGMAHVCALVRSGHNVIGLVDIDSNRLNSFKDRWYNEWAGKVEEVSVNPDCIYATSFDLFYKSNKKRIDLVISCVPPLVQDEVFQNIRLLHHGDVMIEKPIMVQQLDDSTFVSCEWVNHTSLQHCSQIENIRMSYEKSNETWKEKFTSYSDLSPHLYSILYSKNVRLGKVLHRIEFGDMTEVCFEGIKLVTDRTPPYGLQINGVNYDWEDDLFDKMYSNMMLAKDLYKYIPDEEKNFI